MPETPFLEEFDRSGLYGDERDPSRWKNVNVLIAGGVLAVAVLALVSWLFVFKSDERSPDEWLDLGLAAHVDERFEDAADAYQEVLLIDPSNKFAHYNLGLIAQTQGRLDDAEDSYRRALQTDPVYEPALFNLAILRFDAGDFREAIELYRTVIGINPSNASAHLNLGYALREVGQEEEAAREIAEALTLDSSLIETFEPGEVGAVGSEGEPTPSTSTPSSTTTTTATG